MRIICIESGNSAQLLITIRSISSVWNFQIIFRKFQKIVGGQEIVDSRLSIFGDRLNTRFEIILETK